jgi:hypothetical protein
MNLSGASGAALPRPRSFCRTPVTIFFLLSGLEWLVLRRWHESALKKQI